MDVHASPPPLAALFTVVFDQRKGYTIQWQRVADGAGLDLAGIEFKALPSGLHSETEDLVYFTHQQTFAGVCAFVRAPAGEEQRNAAFLSVGALVPLNYGRLGKAWSHARELSRVGQELVKDNSDTRPLEAYWKQHGCSATNGTASPSSPTSRRRESLPAGTRRKRGLSDSMASLAPEAVVSPHHPAHSMCDLLDLFGPLIFPLIRASVLRKKILLVGEPPVKRMCHFVYAISILASLPRALEQVLPDTELPQLKALFNVGISDFAELSSVSKHQDGWLASTTDNILGEKQSLYDILVTLPESHIGAAAPRRWPTIRTSNQETIKATQRDLRRYLILRDDLKRVQLAREHFSSGTDFPSDSEDRDDDSMPLLRRQLDAVQPRGNDSDIIEQVSWASMAYKGFLWWASAGEQDAWENEESRNDRDLLSDLPLIHKAFPQSPSAEQSDLSDAQETATILTAYFQRLTTFMLQTLAEIVESADDETDEGIQEDVITVTSEDVRQMGLDPWSQADKAFVHELMERCFGRQASIEDGGLRVCGMRIC